MLRGTRTFVCDECGHRFKGMDLEWNGTALSQPLKCPKCGSWHTWPKSWFGLDKCSYEEIWEQMDRIHQK